MNNGMIFFGRYRYPIYNNKRFDLYDFGGGDDGDDPVERFMSGSSRRPLRNKKPYSLSPRYDLTMTPYDLKVMEKLYRNGRRKRTPDLYDLKQVYKLYEAGRKRGMLSDEGNNKPHKRNDDFTHNIWGMAHMADIGKRSPVTNYYDLLDMTKLANAGKRSGADSYSLWQLAQMEAAGKKRGSVSDYDLLSLARVADAGKRGGPFGPSQLDDLSLGELDQDEDADEDSDDGQLAAKKKRSLDDYFGWDRKKKSISEDELVNGYLHTMKEEVLGDSEKSDADNVNAAMKTEENGEQFPPCLY